MQFVGNTKPLILAQNIRKTTTQLRINTTTTSNKLRDKTMLPSKGFLPNLML